MPLRGRLQVARRRGWLEFEGTSPLEFKEMLYNLYIPVGGAAETDEEAAAATRGGGSGGGEQQQQQQQQQRGSSQHALQPVGREPPMPE